MQNKEQKIINQNELVLRSFSRNNEVNNFFRKYNIRFFYQNGLHVGYGVTDYTKIESSYSECSIHTGKNKIADYICFDTEKYRGIVYLHKITKEDYTYSKIEIYDKITKKAGKFTNASIEEHTSLIKKLLKK